MRTIRKFLPLVLIMASLGILAACGVSSQKTGGSEKSDQTSQKSNALVIVSPHDEAIEQELTPAFREWYANKHPGTPAPELEWQNRGGSVDINKYLVSAYAALGDSQDHGVGIDLYFGGGAPAHAQLKEKNLSAPVDLPPATLASIPNSLSGVALRDPDNRWFGVVLSSFGIIYNRVGLKAKSLPAPQTWADLTSPAYMNSLVLADPAKSGSARVCYEVILEKHGWENGWGLLMQIAGNTREFTPGSSDVPRDVAQGSALAGMCIDYYAWSQIAQTGEDVVGFVTPTNATAITPDPIGMLRGAPHPELAREFILFTLSPECQSLFGLKAGQPGGPKNKTLFRMPIRPDIYQHPPTTRSIPINPFDSAASFNVNEKLANDRSPVLGPLFTAAFLSNKQQLQSAWQAVNAHLDQPQLKAKFTAAPFSEQQSLDFASRVTSSAREAISLSQQWQEAFKKRYEEIVAGK